MLPGESTKKSSSIKLILSSLSYWFIRLFKTDFFSLISRKNLNSIERDFIVLKILFELLFIIKKKVLSFGSSRDLSKALDELTFRYSALSIRTILIFDLYVDLLKNFCIFLTSSILIFSSLSYSQVGKNLDEYSHINPCNFYFQD